MTEEVADFEEPKKPVVLENPDKVKAEEKKIELEVLSYPNPILNVPVPEYGDAEEIQHAAEFLTELAEAMKEKMYDNAGIGLAANQCGLDERMIVIDVEYPQHGKKAPLVMLNPEVIWSSEDTETVTEGCLSVPFEFQGDVTRPARVKVQYSDLAGELHTKKCAGLEACCVQHEIDHLNGVLFISYLSRLRRDMIQRKVEKYLRRYLKGHKKAIREVRNLRKSEYRGKK